MTEQVSGVPDASGPEATRTSKGVLTDSPRLFDVCDLTVGIPYCIHGKMSSLRNYAEEYSLIIPEDASHSEVAEIVFR